MYLVLEIQSTEDNVSTLSYSYDDQKTAMNKYYTILAAASSSEVPYHGAAFFDNAALMKADFIDHTMVYI